MIVFNILFGLILGSDSSLKLVRTVINSHYCCPQQHGGWCFISHIVSSPKPNLADCRVHQKLCDSTIVLGKNLTSDPSLKLDRTVMTQIFAVLIMIIDWCCKEPMNLCPWVPRSTVTVA